MIAPRLIAITDTSVAPAASLVKRLESLCRRARPGSVLVQLRDPALSIRERRELGAALRAVTRELGQLFAVNDRLDLALLLEADGLHLGEHGVETRDARRLVGELWISRALHDPHAAIDADAVLLSPVCAPRKGRPALGFEALRACRARLGSGVRLYALGGVDAESARVCLEHGADGVAAIGAALDERSAGKLLEALGIDGR